MKTKEVNIIVGRFQPITTGHIKCAQYARDKKNLPTLLCMIDTPMEKVDAKHPFPSGHLSFMYHRMFLTDENIVGIILVKNADIVKISEICAFKNYRIAAWTCGTDRYKAYKAMSERYKEQANLTDDFELLEVPRTDDDESATKLRQALHDDDKETFAKLFPGPLKYYDELREQYLQTMGKLSL
jgi:nicotinic acid mononucleotide adenylyltransferase